MDLAKYCVDAVLVEGRSVRAVAAATGRSKSWVHRHVTLYRVGGDEALVPAQAGPEGAGQPHLGGDRGRDRGAGASAWPTTASTPGHGPSVAHRAKRGPPPALSTIHRVLRPARLCHAPAPETAPLELDALRVAIYPTRPGSPT